MQKEIKPMDKTKRKLFIFALLVILLSSGLYSYIIKSSTGVNSGSVFVIGLMWVPGISALISKLVVDHSIRGLGWRIHKKSLPYIGMAYVIPLILCFMVYGFAWLTGIGTLGDYSITQIIIFAIAGVLISCLAAVGEEIGWRGFLLTELRQIVPVKLISVIIGVVWYLYHVPAILFSDYNNENIPYSLLCFFIMVMGFTIVANFLCVKAQSFWPAVLLHASHNVFVQSIFDSITVTGKYTKYFTSEFGIGLAVAYIGIAIAGAFILHVAKKNDKNLD